MYLQSVAIWTQNMNLNVMIAVVFHGLNFDTRVRIYVGSIHVIICHMIVFSYCIRTFGL